jgi:hypothetical protein
MMVMVVVVVLVMDNSHTVSTSDRTKHATSRQSVEHSNPPKKVKSQDKSS